MNRRNFLKVAGVSGAVVAISPSMITGQLHASNGTLLENYERVQLVDADGNPIKASSLKKETNYVFNYPYVSTPSILLNLEKPTQKDVKLTSADGVEYIWSGGAGKDNALVAFSAICSHQLAHPTPDDSFIQYITDDEETMAYERGGVVVCSSHLSAFDAHGGCKRLSGPANEPLASVILEVEDDDTIWASAVLGPDKFHEYFKTFKPELNKYYGGRRKAKRPVKDSVKTVTLKEFTKDIIKY